MGVMNETTEVDVASDISDMTDFYTNIAGCDFFFDFNFNFSEPLNMSLCSFDTFSAHNQAEFDVLKTTPYAATVIVLYIVVIFLGAIGNSMVVLTVVKTRQMWNATNIFIANLAVTDVFVCVFDLPISAYYQLTDDWIFGKTLCHIFLPAFAIVVYASTLTLTMISIDRYLLIVFPFKRRMSVRTALILVVVIAIFAAAVASPIAFYAKYVIVDQADIKLYKRYCMESWPSHQLRVIYTIVTLVLQYFMPLILIAILYSFIFQKVRKRVKNKNSRKTKTTKMLLAVVAVFAISWTPFHLYAITAELGIIKGKYFKFIDALMRVFAMSSSCINPFLYGWMNDNYRTAFFSIIRKGPIGQVSGINREDSDETKRSIVTQNSPIKKCRKKSQVNGSLCQGDGKQDHIQLKDLIEDKKSYGNHVTSPLLKKFLQKADV